MVTVFCEGILRILRSQSFFPFSYIGCSFSAALVAVHLILIYYPPLRPDLNKNHDMLDILTAGTRNQVRLSDIPAGL